MREIKFRAWDREHYRMLMPFTLADLSYKSDGGVINLKDWDDLANIEDLEWMQYTGLKDKSGKEIYEGDVVDEHCANFRKVVVNELWLAHKLVEIDRMESPMNYVEVIGNIYENPELVK